MANLALQRLPTVVITANRHGHLLSSTTFEPKALSPTVTLTASPCSSPSPFPPATPTRPSVNLLLPLHLTPPALSLLWRPSPFDPLDPNLFLARPLVRISQPSERAIRGRPFPLVTGNLTQARSSRSETDRLKAFRDVPTSLGGRSVVLDRVVKVVRVDLRVGRGTRDGGRMVRRRTTCRVKIGIPEEVGDLAKDGFGSTGVPCGNSCRQETTTLNATFGEDDLAALLLSLPSEQGGSGAGGYDPFSFPFGPIRWHDVFHHRWPSKPFLQVLGTRPQVLRVVRGLKDLGADELDGRDGRSRRFRGRGDRGCHGEACLCRNALRSQSCDV
jgi:hypothetical protein